MSDTVKRTEDFEVADLARFPVWEYVNRDDTLVRPVLSLPTDSLAGRLVGTKLRLANGSEVWAVLSNVHLRSVRQTAQFIGVWVTKEGKWFTLARYHDVDRDRRSPQGLADFLGLSLAEVFPLSYDISAVANGLPETVHGTIPAEPAERLTRDQLIKLALQPDG